VFSPYYAQARRRGSGDPLNHVSVNAILYRPRGKRWAMTERGRGTLDHSARHLEIGRSRLEWDGDRLHIDIDEWTAPAPRRLKGRVTLHPGPVFEDWHSMDDAGRHFWRPILPIAQAEVAFEHPSLRWRGGAYCDTNRGSEPLEKRFRSWNWSRMGGPSATRILYETEPRAEPSRNLALEYRADGTVQSFEPPRRHRLKRTGWRVGRETRSERTPKILRTLEDTPFYTRSIIASALGGADGVSIHESVDLDRFAAPWVQMLLPFKMPRRFW